MERFEAIREGFAVQTTNGHFEAKTYTGELVCGIERETDGNGNIISEKNGYYSLAEISDLMKDWDGKNHNVYWED